MNRKLILLGTTIACALRAHAAFADTQTYPAAGVKILRLDQNEGYVHITGINNDEIKITITKTKGGDKCTAEVKPNDDGAFIVRTKHTILRSLTCDFEIALVIPQNLAIEGKVGSSKIELAGVRGPLNLDVGAGQVLGNLASSNAHISVSSGKILLMWTEKPEAGVLDLSVAAGKMELQFPKDTVINMALKKGIGKLTNDLTTNRNAPLTVKGTLGVGSITLKQAQ